jgi:hypothetical protein
MKNVLWFILLVSAAIWIINLRRHLRAAQMRGDMYRDSAIRLDRRLEAMSRQQTPPEHS